MQRITLVVDAVRTSFWFAPTLMTLVAAALALALIVVDQRVSSETIRALSGFYTGGAQGARSLLAAVAGAVVTVVGVAFSVTVVSLQLASTQLGPRVLQSFIRDRGNQAVVGTFVATFVYCLLVLRTVRGEDGLTGGFVPHLAVTGGVLLAIVSAAVLIYFIHHAAVTIQADHVIATVAHELHDTIRALYPERRDECDEAPEGTFELPAGFQDDAHVIESAADGYVQSIAVDRLVALATAHDALIRLESRAGDFLMAGEPLARVWPPDRLDPAGQRRLRSMVVLGRARTAVQDVSFGVDQLVEIAVRALSSGLRDPMTAVRCVDRLGAALARLAGRRLPSPYHRDHERVRLIVRPLSLSELTDAAFDEIRERAAPSLVVTLRLLAALERVARLQSVRPLHAALLRQAALIGDARRQYAAEGDRRAVERAADAVRQALRADVVAPALLARG